MLSTRTTLVTLLVGLSVLAPVTSPSAKAQDATPTAPYSCDDAAAADVAATPRAAESAMAGICDREPPVLQPVGSQHLVSCFLYR